MWDQPKIKSIIFVRSLIYIIFLISLILLISINFFNVFREYGPAILLVFIVYFPFIFWVLSFECPRCNEKIHRPKEEWPKNEHSFFENYKHYHRLGNPFRIIRNNRFLTKKCVHCGLNLK